jgi:hypothetical protein
LGGEDAVIAIDAVCNTCVIPVREVSDVARRHTGARGIVGLRRALVEADAGAESPWETRTRLAIRTAGLPRPRTQVVVRDRYGVIIARLDLGWDRQERRRPRGGGYRRFRRRVATTSSPSPAQPPPRPS